MEHTDLLNLLQEYKPQLEVENQFKTRMINFLMDSKHPFDRNNLVGHFTASCFLLNKNEDKALLMLHAKLGKWVQPGGHADGESNLLNVSIKEAEEESGLTNIVPIRKEIFDLDIHLIPKSKDVPEHFHFDVRFLLKTLSDNLAKKNHESKELIWIGKKDPVPSDEYSVVRLFEKWNHPL